MRPAISRVAVVRGHGTELSLRSAGRRLRSAKATLRSLDLCLLPLEISKPGRGMRVTWHSAWFGSHFVISHGETVKLPWVRPWWLWGGFGLRAVGSDVRFRNLFEKSGLAAVVTTACSNAAGKPLLVQYSLGDGPWFVPWERSAEFFKEEATATS